LGFAQQGAVENPLLASEVLQEDPLIAVLPEGHRLADQSAISLGELASDPFVGFPRRLAPAYFDELNSLCRQHGFSPRIVQEAKGVDATLGLVAAGLGVALLPGSVTSLRREHVRLVHLAGTSTIVSTYVVWRNDDARPVLRRFVDVAIRHRVTAEHHRDKLVIKSAANGKTAGSVDSSS
jgi:DNA-binding transcriptional LysR family regulator